MDLKGSLVDTHLKIIPSNNLINYLKNISINDEVPINVIKLVKGTYNKSKQTNNNDSTSHFVDSDVEFTDKDIENLNKIKVVMSKIENNKEETTEDKVDDSSKEEFSKADDPKNALSDTKEDDTYSEGEKKETDLFLITSDIHWLYTHLQSQRNEGVKEVPYLHALLENSSIELPDNKVIKRNPVLEARCVKLRAQQEAREYRKMTKTVDNVRMRFPEDSISYQMKQLNRQLIAVGQFLLSIFAGFLFGFRGVEWMVGNLDFGFRLLLGVMCALVIALAEIYFLAKKLNEELNIPETVQLGGPTKFANPPKCHNYDIVPNKVPRKDELNKAIDKEHQD